MKNAKMKILTMVVGVAVFLAFGQSQALAYITFQNWSQSVSWSPALPPPGSGANYASSKAACSGNSTETTTYTPVCPTCWYTSEFWGSLFCSCPAGYSNQQTYTFAWTDTSYQTTQTFGAGVNVGATLPAGEVLISVNVNADGTQTATILIQQGYCNAVPIGSQV